MFDAFFLIGLPYIAVTVCIVGSIYRYRSNQFSYSSLRSQFLENRNQDFRDPGNAQDPQRQDRGTGRA